MTYVYNRKRKQKAEREAKAEKKQVQQRLVSKIFAHNRVTKDMFDDAKPYAQNLIDIKVSQELRREPLNELGRRRVYVRGSG